MANCNLSELQDFWNHVLLIDETKVEMLTHNALRNVWQKQHNNMSAQASQTSSRAKCEAICLTAESLVMKQDNDYKHENKSTTERQKNKRIKVLP